MSRALLICALLIHLAIVTHAQPLQMLPDNDIRRFKDIIYQQNATFVNRHNADPSTTYKLELNAFAALTTQQIVRTYLGLIPSSPFSLQHVRNLVQEKKMQRGNQNNVRLVPDTVSLRAPAFATRIAQTVAPISSLTSISAAAAPPLTISENNIAPRLFTRATPINLEPQSTLALQEKVLEQVRKYMQAKNITRQETEETIQKFKAIIIPEGTSSKSTSGRLLQTVSESGYAGGSLNGPKQPINITIPLRPEAGDSDISNLTKFDVDWSCLSGRVKFQGKCGSCYAFATVDSVGALIAIYQYGFHADLSIQEIIDCPKLSATFGCNGGFLEGALGYMMLTGVLTDYTYPYTSANSSKISQSCRYDEKTKIIRHRISNFQQIAKNDCDELKLQLRQQPIAIGISILKLTLYKEGVFNGCSPDDPADHAVVLVGYKEGVGWKIKNSWGPMWGVKGYAWLAPGNTCQICQTAFYPIPETAKATQNYWSNKRINSCPPP